MRERFPSLDADDVIQETLIELIRVFPVYHYSPAEKGHFHNYLTGILRHRALRMMNEEETHAARQRKCAEEKSERKTWLYANTRPAILMR